jgi:periplasmic protein TonB
MILSLDRAPPRLSLSMLLAAPLVYALFLMASWLVKVDEVVLVAKPDRPLLRITPQEVIIDTLHKPPAKMELTVIDKPPPPPRPAIDTRGDVPVFTFGEPAAVFDRVGLKPPVVSVTPLTGRNIKVIRAPAPSMPPIALARGISGSCDVLFDVDTRGRPFNLSAQCTDKVFEAEAIRSVSKAEFLPKINAQGIAAEQHGAIYPLVFEVN